MNILETVSQQNKKIIFQQKMISSNRGSKKQKQKVQRSFTNQVLSQKSEKDQSIVFYVPGYLRMKLKNFTQMDIGSLKAQINATLIFTIYYGQLPQLIVNHLIHHLVFGFGRDDALKLDTKSLEISLKHQESKKQFTYTVRKIFKTKIQCDVFYSPFQLVNLILSITLQSITFNIVKDNKKVLKVQIKFNLMDHSNSFMKASYSEQGRFGNYDLAQALMVAQYSSDRINKSLKKEIEIAKQQRQRKKKKKSGSNKNQADRSSLQLTLKSQIPKLLQRTVEDVVDYSRTLVGSNALLCNKIDESDVKQDKKIKHFQYAHFTIPLYRLPSTAIVTIFLPLYLLSIINLGIFFQSNDLGNRIASLATMMIAFMSLIATIRQQIPPSPKITMLQYLVYLQTLTSFFGFIHSLYIRNLRKFSFIWYNDTLFLLSMFITTLNLCIVTLLYTKHYLIWQPSYNRFQDQQEIIKFKSEQWNNVQCQQHFKNHRSKVLTMQELQENYQELMKLIKSKQLSIQQIQ